MGINNKSWYSLDIPHSIIIPSPIFQAIYKDNEIIQGEFNLIQMFTYAYCLTWIEIQLRFCSAGFLSAELLNMQSHFVGIVSVCVCVGVCLYVQTN